VRRRLGYLAVGTGVAMLKPAVSRVVLLTGGAALCVLLVVH
jgi:hypothetical protein